jgi:adenosylcobinamide-phosphate synthase
MELALIILFACALDALLGDPRAWPHLVRAVGFVINRLEHSLLNQADSSRMQLLKGAALTILVVGGFSLLSWLSLYACSLIWQPLAWLAGAVLCFQCIAAGQLWREAVHTALPLARGDIMEARQRLAQ